MKKLLTILIIVFAQSGFGQGVDTVQAESLELIIKEDNWDNAKMYTIGDSIPFSGVMVSYYSGTNKIETMVQFKNGETTNCWSRKFYQNGQIKEELWYGKSGIEDGKYTSWHENGSIKTSGQYLKGEKSGKWMSYYLNGIEESVNYYKNENSD